MAELFMNILTPVNVASPRAGERILRTLCDEAPHFSPQRYGSSEPLRHLFDDANIDDALNSWPLQPFLWRRSRPTVRGRIFVAPEGRPNHTVVALSADISGSGDDEVVRLLQSWGRDLHADFGFIRIPAPRDIQSGIDAGVLSPIDRRGTRFTMFVTSHDLRRCLPDAYWGTLFGPAYVRHFGKDRILTAPAHLVRDLGDDVVYMQMTPRIEDTVVRPEHLASVRDHVKVHLGARSFFDSTLGVHYPYAIPEFRFGEELGAR